MTTLTRTIDGGNVENETKTERVILLTDIFFGAGLLFAAVLAWILAFHLASNVTITTSQMAFSHPSNVGVALIALLAILAGAIGAGLIIDALAGKYGITTFCTALVLGIILSVFVSSPSSSLTLSSWAEQRYGIQLDESSIQSLGKLHDGGLLATDGQTMIVTLHSGQEGFLLYDSKNQQELPLKGTSR